MNGKMLCVMAGYDDATEEHLALLQKSLYNSGFFGTHTKNLPQHITLATFDTTQEEIALMSLRQAASVTNAFNISFNHTGVFGGAKVLFIAPDPNRELLTLKEHFGQSDNWTPHTTMLIDEPETIYRAIPFIMEGFHGFGGMVTSLYLYEFWPARLIEKVLLK